MPHRNSRLDAKDYVARERATRCCHGHKSTGGARWNHRRQGRIGVDNEGYGWSSIEENAGRPSEPLTEKRYDLPDLTGVTNNT